MTLNKEIQMYVASRQTVMSEEHENEHKNATDNETLMQTSQLLRVRNVSL